ncbi:transposase family protein [Streptomyces sp. NPDC056069]|uniref:transposase family protein n=1 Tax=Streptomyces sp. NPDC056069 TaxID=3345702 RepID=UPI0035D70505
MPHVSARPPGGLACYLSCRTGPSATARIPAQARHPCLDRGRVFRISGSTARAYAHSVITHLAARAPTLTPARCGRHVPGTCSVDGTPAGCDRVGSGQDDYSGSGRHRRHGVNIQAVTGPAGKLIWYSSALPGRTADITAARTHENVTICGRLKTPALADKAGQGAGGTFATPVTKHRDRELTIKEQSAQPGTRPTPRTLERASARLKAWQIFRRARVTPSRLTSTAKANLTLERQR